MQGPWTIHGQASGGRSPLAALPRSTGIHDKQPTLICSGRAVYFKWHFCSLNKSTLVTWINPLHPDSAPSHKSAWTVRSAGTRGGSAHPLLNGYRGKHRAGSDWNPGLPFQITLALVSPSCDWAQSKAELPWPAWSSSSKNVWDHLQTTSRAIVKQSIGSKDLTPPLKVSRWTFFTKKKKK